MFAWQDSGRLWGDPSRRLRAGMGRHPLVPEPGGKEGGAGPEVPPHAAVPPPGGRSPEPPHRKRLATRSTTNAVAQPRVVGTDQVWSGFFTSVLPRGRLTTRREEPMRYESTMAPWVAATAASTMLVPVPASIGAVTEAAVIMATVPLPCAMRTMVATMKGKSTAGRAEAAMVPAK